MNPFTEKDELLLGFGNRGKETLYYRGYRYNNRKLNYNTTTWRCSKGWYSCQATMRTSLPPYSHPRVVYDHNHPPDVMNRLQLGERCVLLNKPVTGAALFVQEKNSAEVVEETMRHLATFDKNKHKKYSDPVECTAYNHPPDVMERWGMREPYDLATKPVTSVTSLVQGKSTTEVLDGTKPHLGHMYIERNEHEKYSDPVERNAHNQPPDEIIQVWRSWEPSVVVTHPVTGVTYLAQEKSTTEVVEETKPYMATMEKNEHEEYSDPVEHSAHNQPPHVMERWGMGEPYDIATKPVTGVTSLVQGKSTTEVLDGKKPHLATIERNEREKYSDPVEHSAHNQPPDEKRQVWRTWESSVVLTHPVTGVTSLVQEKGTTEVVEETKPYKTTIEKNEHEKDCHTHVAENAQHNRCRERPYCANAQSGCSKNQIVPTHNLTARETKLC